MSRIRQVAKTGNPLVDGVFRAGNAWDMSSGPIQVKIGTANGHNGDGGWFRAVDVKGREVFVPDALARNGRAAAADRVQMPLTPPRVWELLQG